MNRQDSSRRAMLAGLAAAGAIAALGGPSPMIAPARAQLPEQTDQPPRLDVPFVPTPQAVVDRMLEIARVTGRDFVMDLGCGDGRMLVTAASRFGSRGRGVDIDPQRIEEANANARKANVADKVSFAVQNLFDTTIREADVLTMYLLPGVNLQLRPRILDEMKPGSRIVSHAFDMGDWEADLRDQVGYSRIYFWLVPAKIAGKWIISDGADEIEATLVQQFQKITGGVARAPGGSGTVAGLVSGDEARLLIQVRGEAKIYAGRVSGDRMTPLPGGGAQGWTAARA